MQYVKFKMQNDKNSYVFINSGYLFDKLSYSK